MRLVHAAVLLFAVCCSLAGAVVAAPPASDFSCDLQVEIVDALTDKPIADAVVPARVWRGPQPTEETLTKVADQPLKVSMSGLKAVSIDPESAGHEAGGVFINSEMIDALAKDKKPWIVMFEQPLKVDLARRHVSGSVRLPLMPNVPWRNQVVQAQSNLTATGLVELEKDVYACGYTLAFKPAPRQPDGRIAMGDRDRLTLTAMERPQAVELARKPESIAAGQFVLIIKKDTTTLYAGEGLSFVAGVQGRYKLFDGSKAPEENYGKSCNWPTVNIMERNVGPNEFVSPQVLFFKDADGRFGKLNIFNLDAGTFAELRARASVNTKPGDNRFREIN